MLSHDALCNAACETTVWGPDIYMHAGPSVHSGRHIAIQVDIKPLLMLGTMRPGVNALSRALGKTSEQCKDPGHDKGRRWEAQPTWP